MLAGLIFVDCFIFAGSMEGSVIQKMYMYIYDKRIFSFIRYQSCSFVARGRVGGPDTNSYKAITNSNDPYVYTCLHV